MSVRKITNIFTIFLLLRIISSIGPAFAQYENYGGRTDLTRDESDTVVLVQVGDDNDLDGMPNWWEIMYGLDPGDPSDAHLDPDRDGLTNLQEYIYGTDPFNWDTDGGTLSDGDEIAQGKNPLDPWDDVKDITISDRRPKTKDPRADSDGDGINNIDEKIYGTDPHKRDTDDDGINDYDEIFVYGTNPLSKDTDGDGISDFDEIFVYGTDPLLRDTDFDGLTDGEEVFKYGTDPLNWDTDGGNVSDYDEILNNTDPFDYTDDFQIDWKIYIGQEPNDLFFSQNKLDSILGYDIILEATKPKEAASLVIHFNGSTTLTREDKIRIMHKSPEKVGLYTMELIVFVPSGKSYSLRKYVNVEASGTVYSQVGGVFKPLYGELEYFKDKTAANIKIKVEKFDEYKQKSLPYKPELFDQNYPEYADREGRYVLFLEPGVYKVIFDQPTIEKKEFLVYTDKPMLFAENISVTRNYDGIIWAGIFSSIYTLVWRFANIVGSLFTKKGSKPKSKKDIVHEKIPEGVFLKYGRK